MNKNIYLITDLRSYDCCEHVAFSTKKLAEEYLEKLKLINSTSRYDVEEVKLDECADIFVGRYHSYSIFDGQEPVSFTDSLNLYEASDKGYAGFNSSGGVTAVSPLSVEHAKELAEEFYAKSCRKHC